MRTPRHAKKSTLVIALAAAALAVTGCSTDSNEVDPSDEVDREAQTHNLVDLKDLEEYGQLED